MPPQPRSIPPLRNLIVTVTTATLFLTSACDESRFSASTPRKPAVESPKPKPVKPNGQSDDGQPQETIEEEFFLDQTAGSIDMVWLIDTSGSMREETAQVQRNFANFASTLASRSGTKFALIANKPSGFSGIGIDLGFGTGDRIQIETSVGSSNALAIAAAAICPAQTTPSLGSSSSIRPASLTICSQAVTATENAAGVAGVAGQLSSFFRKEAKPIFVIVTDDDARAVTDQNFLNMVQPHLMGRSPTVYAFRGRESRPNCSVARPGVAYENLAAATGGTVFDICEPDWSPHFSNLGQAVIELIQSTFDLKNRVQRLVKVMVDDLPLGESDYEISGQSITLKKGAVSSDAKKLKVIYESN